MQIINLYTQIVQKLRILLDVKFKTGSPLVTRHICWVPSHVGIQGNERVDVLAKLALIEAYTNIKIPYTDLVYYAKSHLRKTGNFSGINQFRANLIQYILNWFCGITHPSSVEETN